MWNSSTSLKTTRAVRNDDAGLNAAFFYSPAPANRLAVFSTAGRRASAGPQIHVFLAMLPCPSKRAIPGSSKTNRRAYTPSIKTEVMDLLTERARSACLDADRSTHPPH